MKKCRLLLSLFQKMFFPAFLLIVLIGITELALLNFSGTYRYHTYVQRLFQEIPHIERSLYAMRFGGVSPNGEDILKTQEELSRCSAVQYCYTKVSLVSPIQVDGETMTLVLYPEELLDGFPSITQKNDFTETGMAQGKIQCLAASPHLESSALGSLLTIRCGNVSWEAEIIGKVRSPYYMPFFNVSSNFQSAYNILRESNILAVKDTPQIRELLSDFRLQANPNFFIILSPDATEAQRREVTDCLEGNAYQHSAYDSILQNTREATVKKLEGRMLLSAYLVIISFTMTLCVSVLFLHHRQETLSVYLLCGCSKRKGLGIALLALGSLAALATLVNAVLLLLYQVTDYQIDAFLLDGVSILPAACYLLVLLPLTALVTAVLYRGVSPIQIRKGAEQ